jgi:enoyl-CoA hydratase
MKGFEQEIEEFSKCFDTKDMKEGAEAFLQKRKPNFKGE